MRLKSVLHGRQARLALAAFAVPGLLAAGAMSAAASSAPTPAAANQAATTGAASTGAASTGAATHAGKRVPTRPATISPGAGLGAAIPAKPHRAAVTRRLAAWTVSLTDSSNWLWPTQYSTLTATASMNVGPTPYYLRIYDETANAYVVTCGTGTTCAVPVTQLTPATHYYVAIVSDPSASYPPGSVQATSSAVGVVWQGVNLSLSASPTTVPIGAATTLTATTSTNIGPSPFWTEIYDATTQTRVGVCGSGTSCSATVSESAATTHEFVAYLSYFSAAYPPSGIQKTSLINFVTWSNTGWRVSLSAPSASFGNVTATATANGNVGPTPYYIDIFNASTGALVAACGVGSTCSTTFSPGYSGTSLVAFIAYDSPTFPPAGTVASSNVTTSYRRIIG
ncbi:MAG: trimeric autotransporter adhesin [Streptosporangiaceae bacterium]|jgi:hypothetical protein|nr:trimeric autotransporter adhesin [Streptosporangiaceae bacterium]